MSRADESRFERLRIPGILPLELCELIVDDEPLGESIRTDGFPDKLCRAIEALRRGHSLERLAGAPFPFEACRGIAAVALAGRGADAPGLHESLARIGLPIARLPEGDFPAERGGMALLASRGLRGMVVDMGQTSVKISWAGTRTIVARDEHLLPHAALTGAVNDERFRPRLRRFLADALQAAAAAAPVPPPEALLAGLPAELDDAGTPGHCSYKGLPGYTTLVPEAARETGLAPRAIIVMNDAELAAASVIHAPPAPAARPLLTLTLGHGLGAALIRPIPY